MAKLTLITGDGRGKTSTAIGHIFLEIQNGKEVIVTQFLKTGKNSGEREFFDKYYQLRWYCFGKSEFYVSDEQLEEFRNIVKEGIDKISNELNKAKIDILLLDELGIALSYDLVEWKDLQTILGRVKEEIIITGRKIPDKIRSRVDEIINIEEVKHPYNEGIVARKGIDF
ncbi:MAG: cob(I)yrinic acid a,c-diamide adenosyltransferase [Candidatus Heimdallarchaeota archaeon]|nr:cob(I)yrinic acid a,c-diamide adenosyltransferase [Candidatus Heimdallarchaeota archaeon]